LEALAVLRGGARDPHVAALSGLPVETIRAARDEALGAGLVYSKDGRWLLDSGSLADQLLARMARVRRRELHQAAAELLEADAVPDAPLLSTLWLEAGVKAKAGAASVLAAEACERADDPAGAALHYAHAARWLGRQRAARGRLRLRQAEML